MNTITLRHVLSLISFTLSAGFVFASQAPPAVRVESLLREPVTVRVSTYGILSPKTESLSFRLPGRIAIFEAEEGESVVKGQLLASLETSDREDDLEQKRVRLGQVQRAYERMGTLHQKGYIQKSQLEDSAVELGQAQIAFQQAQLNLQRCKLIAPSDGTILKEFEESRTTIGAGQPIFSFQSNDEAWVTKVELTDKNAFALGEGAIAEVQFAPYPGVKFPGELTKLAQMANPRDGLYTAEIRIVKGDLSLRQGMVAEVDLFQSSKQSFVQMPLDAITNLRGNKGYAFFLDSKQKRVHKVRLTIRTIINNMVAIEEKLEDYSLVVVRGHTDLNNGDLVTILSN